MAFFQPNLTTNFLYAQNINIQQFSPDTFERADLYVNSVTGIDAGAGRGTSSTAPYLNLSAALKDAFALSTKFMVQIHLAGANDHEIADGYVFPFADSSDQITTDPAPTFGLTKRAPIVIRADPTSVKSIVGGDIVGQANDANSGLKIITTTGGHVANAYDGLWLQDANGVLARIRSNTAAVLNLDYAGADLTAPLTVYQAGATLAPDVPASGNPTVALRGGSAPYIFFGVNIEAATGGAVQVGMNQQASFIACDIPSISVGDAENTAITGEGAVECIACNLASLNLPYGNLVLQNSRFLAGTFTNMNPESRIVATACSFDDMNSALFSDGTNSPGFVSGTNLVVSDSLTHGVSQFGGILRLSVVDVEGSAGAGVRGRDQAQISLATVTSSANNTGAGLDLATGAHAAVGGATNLLSAGNDIVLGALPVVSFATFAIFRGGEKPSCALVAGDGCAVYESDLGGTANDGVATTALDANLLPQNLLTRVDATAAPRTVTLPPAASCPGRQYNVKKIDATANTVTIEGDGAETIDGAANQVLAAQFESMTVISNGTSWDII